MRTQSILLATALLLTGISLYSQSVTDGITFITPPTPNQQGSAGLTYPLTLPPGRQDMAPDLVITYDSEGSSGWLGEGWGLSTPTISVDTRWGVPRYSRGEETESYLYNGQQLYPLAHRGPVRERVTDERFFPRIEGTFERIIRHGNSPGNYWWEVTDTDGKTAYYGGSPTTGPVSTAILRSNNGSICTWALVQTIDLSGNTIRYHYSVVEHTGLANSGVAGQQLYPDYITYTGFGSEEGPFRVDFIRDRELGMADRSDISIDMRLGFKQVTADLLQRVEITYKEQLIRAYQLDYAEGAFRKTLLQSITEENASGEAFYSHTFDYYDDVRVNGGYEPFENATNWDIPDDNIKGGILNPIPTMNGETSAIGGSSSSNFSAGGAATVGFNDFNLVSKDKTAGGTYAYGSSNDEGLIALVDINGDALPDKVFQSGNSLYYRANQQIAGTDEYSFGPQRPISGIAQFSTSKTTSNSWGFEGNPPGGFVGFEYTNATTNAEVYFSDFNGDGLLDIARKGEVFFNHLNENGDPVFTSNSGDTPSPILAGAELDGGLIEIDPEEIEERIDEYPLHDVIRMWEAPYAGTVQVNSTVQLLAGEEPDASNYDQQDGVQVSIQHGPFQLWEQRIEGRDFGVYNADIAGISVNQGDRLYFRVQSVFDGAYDQVHWNPQITYSDFPLDEVDANGISLGQFIAAEDFVLSGEQQVGLPFAGTLQMEGDFRKPATSDDVRVSVFALRDELQPRILFDTTFLADSIINMPISFSFAGTDEDDIYCVVSSETQIDWRAIDWVPNLFYTDAPDMTIEDENGDPLFAFCPSVNMQMFNKVWRRTAPLVIPVSGNYTFEPTLDISRNPDDLEGAVRFSIKHQQRVLHVQEVGVEVLDDFSNIQLDLNEGDSLFVEYHFDSFISGRQVDQATYELTEPGADNSATREAGYFSTINPEKEIFGHLHRGWGQFIYNGNRERANQPIDESLLALDEGAEDPPEEIPDDPDNLDGFYDPTSAVFLVTLAEAKTACWLGYDDLTYIGADIMSSSRLGDDNIVPSIGGGSGSGRGAPVRITKMNEYSVAGGIGISVVTGTASQTWTDTEVTIDVMDFNGDRYPDVVSQTSIQYTDARGGLVEGSIRHGFDGHHSASSTATGFTLGGSFVPSRTSNSGEPKGGSSNRRAGKAKRRSAKLGKTSKNAGNTAGDAIGISGTYSTDGDGAKQSWIDINGDGLVDKVFEDGRAALNYGYSFGPAEQWGFPAIQEGESVDFGGGFGINLFNGSIAGGISLTRTDNRTLRTLEDMNGDALPDIVIVDDDGVRVQLNTGTGFAPAIDWLGIEQVDEGSATGESVNGAFTVCIPIVFIGIKICFNPSTSVGRGVSRQLKQLTDINGDAFPDYLESDNDGQLRVKASTIGRTNRLRAVQGPLGASFSVNYQARGTTYDLPYAIWTMSEVRVDDGFAGDGNQRTAQHFVYREGKHDRHERTFYGFGEIETITLNADGDSEILQITQQTYANDNFYEQGLLLADIQLTPDREATREQRYRYELRNPETGTPLLPVQLQQANTRAFPALVEQTDAFYYEQSSPALTQRWTYDYDQYGNLLRQVDLGSGHPSEQVVVERTYHHLDELHYFTQWQTISTSDTRGLLSQRETIVENGDVVQLLEMISESETATYDFNYDTYGNLTTLTRPSNVNGERMFYQYEFDAATHTYLTGELDAYGYKRSGTHDPRYGVQLSATDENGQHTSYQYDDFGRLYQVLSPLDSVNGAPFTYQYQYQLRANVPYLERERYDPEHNISVRDYALVDGLGRVVQTQREAEVVSDENGRPSLQLIVSGAQDTDDVALTQDQYGDVLAPVNQAGQYVNTANGTSPTKLSYDRLERPVSIILPDGQAYQVNYSAASDPAGANVHLATITSPSGQQQQYYTRTNGRVVAFAESGPMGELLTAYNYDGLGRLLSVTDAKGNTTSANYDMLGRQLTLQHPNAGQINYTYDAAGNLLRKTTPTIRANAPNGGAIEYTYEWERLLQIDYPFSPQNQVRYYYGDVDADSNRVGRIYLAEDASGAQEYWYDISGRIRKNVRSMILNEVDIPTFVSEYKYDSWGRLQAVTYPDGEVVEYDFNHQGLPIAIRGEKGGNSYDYLKSCHYDAQGRRRYLAFGNGTVQKIGANATATQLSRWQLQLSGSNNLSDQSYAYTPLGHLEEQRENLNENEQVRALAHNYQYDAYNRLEGATGEWASPEQQIGYDLFIEYDELNNPIEQNLDIIRMQAEMSDTTATSRIFNYDYEQPNLASKVGSREQTYTPDGLPSTYTDGDGSFLLHLWDEEGRLAAYGNNGYVSRYTYDAAGRRAIKSHGPSQGLFVDANPIGIINHGEDEYTLYVSPYLTVVRDSFMKHIYLDDERIVSKPGTGYFAGHLLPPGQQVTAGQLDLSARVRALRELLTNYIEQAAVPPGHPSLPGYYVNPGQPLPSLDTSAPSLTQPPAGWPQPQGRPDPSGPPGHPVWYEEPSNPTNAEPGYGYYDPFGTPELDQYFFHANIFGHVQQITDGFGALRQQQAFTPFGRTLVQEVLLAEPLAQGFNNLKPDSESGLYYREQQYYQATDMQFLSDEPGIAAEPASNPRLWGQGNPFRGTTQTTIAALVTETLEAAIGAQALVQDNGQGNGTQLDVGDFSLASAGAAPAVEISGPDDDKEKRKQKRPSRRNANAGSDADADTGNTDASLNRGGRGLIRNKPLLALRRLFQRPTKPNEEAKNSSEEAPTTETSDLAAQKARNRKFTIRPGDWDGIQQPANRNFRFRPDGKTDNVRRRKRGNGLRVRFRMDRM